MFIEKLTASKQCFTYKVTNGIVLKSEADASLQPVTPLYKLHVF